MRRFTNEADALGFIVRFEPVQRPPKQSELGVDHSFAESANARRAVPQVNLSAKPWHRAN